MEFPHPYSHPPPLREVEDRLSSTRLRLSRFLESLELLGGCVLVLPRRPRRPRPAFRGCGCGEPRPGVHPASPRLPLTWSLGAFLCRRVTLCLGGDAFWLPGARLASYQACTSLGARASAHRGRASAGRTERALLPRSSIPVWCHGSAPEPPARRAPRVQDSYTLRPNLQTVPRGPSTPWGRRRAAHPECEGELGGAGLMSTATEDGGSRVTL